MMPLWIALHQIAAVIWIGGMAFLLLCLRPTLKIIEGPIRLAIMHGALARFFPLVWAAITLLLGSGYAIIFFEKGGLSGVSIYVHIMNLVGLVMTAIFTYLYFAPWQKFRRAIVAADRATAARQLDRMRLFVTINLTLGVFVTIIGASGRFWG